MDFFAALIPAFHAVVLLTIRIKREMDDRVGKFKDTCRKEHSYAWQDFTSEIRGERLMATDEPTSSRLRDLLQEAPLDIVRVGQVERKLPILHATAIGLAILMAVCATTGWVVGAVSKEQLVAESILKLAVPLATFVSEVGILGWMLATEKFLKDAVRRYENREYQHHA